MLVALDLNAVLLLELLSLSLLVDDFDLQLLDLLEAVLEEVLDHVAIHLNVVALLFEFVNFVLEDLQILREFLRSHLGELIFDLRGGLLRRRHSRIKINNKFMYGDFGTVRPFFIQMVAIQSNIYIGPVSRTREASLLRVPTFIHGPILIISFILIFINRDLRDG